MKKYIYTFLFSILYLNSFSNHLVGGRIEYQYLGNKTFKFFAYIERECVTNGAPFESTITAGVFNESNNSRMMNLTFKRDSIGSYKNYYACNLITTCTQVGYYSCIVKINASHNEYLSDSTTNYYINWERCCISENIKNIELSLNTPYSAILDFPRLTILNDTNSVFQNSSPAFKKVFYPLVCINTEFVYDFNFDDADGDSLSYKLIKPYAGGYSSVFNPSPTNGPKPYDEITWADGYSVNNIIDSQTGFSIDSLTGQLRTKPNALGNYLFTIAVEEYRNGYKIGTLYYQSILRVINCNHNYIVEQPKDQYSVPNTPVTFKIKHTDTAATYSWQLLKMNEAVVNIPNANSDSLYLASINSSMDGYKYRCVINTNLCTEYSKYATLHVNSTSINSIKKESIHLIPNPASNEIQFKDGLPRNVKIYTINGMLLKQYVKAKTLDISSLEAGVYIVEASEIENTKDRFFQKLIKVN